MLDRTALWPEEAIQLLGAGQVRNVADGNVARLEEWAGDEQGTGRDGLAAKNRQRKGASPREKV